jgi:hypothetical protein
MGHVGGSRTRIFKITLNHLMKIEVSNGEIVDKYTILLIKSEMIKDEDKLVNINKELSHLETIIIKLDIKKEQKEQLLSVNFSLWGVEDELRECESAKRFDDYFITLARQVYILNDERADIKKQINIDTNSNFTEEKSY